MAYVRKTRDVFVVQGWYGGLYGWEDLVQEDNRADARMRLKEYNENEPNCAHRLTVRRERIAE